MSFRGTFISAGKRLERMNQVFSEITGRARQMKIDPSRDPVQKISRQSGSPGISGKGYDIIPGNTEERKAGLSAKLEQIYGDN